MLRWIPVRFSLRTLFAVLTIAACGAWWWQCPFLVEETEGSRCGPAHSFTTRTFYKRSLFGKPIKVGVERIYENRSADRSYLRSTITWVDGISHGPFEEFHQDGRTRLKGQFVRGQKHGTWTYWDHDGRHTSESEYVHGKILKLSHFDINTLGEKEATVFDYENEIEICERHQIMGKEFPCLKVQRKDFPYVIENETLYSSQLHGQITAWHRNGAKQFEGRYEQNKPDGEWKFWNSAGTLTNTLLFREGKLLAHNDRPVSDKCSLSYVPLVADGVSRRDDFGAWAVCEFHDEPLKQVLESLQSRHRYRQAKMRQKAIEAAGLSPSVKVNCEWRDMPLTIAMFLMAEQLGLTATARHEQIWITTSADLETWQDRVLVPSNAADQDGISPIIAKLNEQTELEFLDTPLAEVADFLTLKHKIPVSLSPNLLTLAKKRGADLPAIFGSSEEEQLQSLPFSLNCKHASLTLRSALEQIMEELDLVCYVTKEGLQFAAPPEVSP